MVSSRARNLLASLGAPKLPAPSAGEFPAPGAAARIAPCRRRWRSFATAGAFCSDVLSSLTPQRFREQWRNEAITPSSIDFWIVNSIFSPRDITSPRWICVAADSRSSISPSSLALQRFSYWRLRFQHRIPDYCRQMLQRKSRSHAQYALFNMVTASRITKSAYRTSTIFRVINAGIQ